MNDAVQSDMSPADGAGAVLHAERRRQNLSLGDVSRYLKLSVRQVEALERDDFSPFGGPVFVHGFIRNYSKLLGVDSEPLIEAADVKLMPPAPPAPEAEADAAHAKPPPRHSLAAAGLVTFVVVAGAVGFYASRGKAPETSEATAPAIELPGVADLPSQAVAPDAAQTERAHSANPTAATAATATDAVEGGVLRMVFDQESWVEVTDGSGNVIFAQLNPAGARRKVTGAPPLSVVVGNAAGVRLSYNDRDVDLTPHTRVDVARLTLK